jgi:hypothetical protein
MIFALLLLWVPPPEGPRFPLDFQFDHLHHSIHFISSIHSTPCIRITHSHFLSVS